MLMKEEKKREKKRDIVNHQNEDEKKSHRRKSIKEEKDKEEGVGGIRIGMSNGPDSRERELEDRNNRIGRRRSKRIFTQR